MHKGDAGMTLRGMFTATGGHTLMAEKMTTEDEAPVTGCAIIMYANGDKYLGMLLDGRRHGEGKSRKTMRFNDNIFFFLVVGVSFA